MDLSDFVAHRPQFMDEAANVQLLTASHTDPIGELIVGALEKICGRIFVDDGEELLMRGVMP